MLADRIIGHAFNRDDVSTMGLPGQHQAGGHRALIEQHCAGAAFTFTAAVFGAHEGQAFAQDEQQRLTRVSFDSVGFPVDSKLNFHRSIS